MIPNMDARLVWLLAGSISLLAGCRASGGLFGVDRCADIPPGAIPQPVGTHVCQWQTAQQDRAERDDFVIFNLEWEAGGQVLGPKGKRHAECLAEAVEQVPYPIVIATSDDAVLDETRRQHVIEMLAANGVEDPAARVVLGESEAEGLYGPEAVRLGDARLIGTGRTTGGGVTGRGFSGGGFGGGFGSGLGGGFGSAFGSGMGGGGGAGY